MSSVFSLTGLELGKKSPLNFSTPEYFLVKLKNGCLEWQIPENKISFAEMQKKRIPLGYKDFVERLREGRLYLANIGVTLPVTLNYAGEDFSVFTYGDESLVPICGYWNCNEDVTIFSCAKREFLEGFLVFDHDIKKFVSPDWPYDIAEAMVTVRENIFSYQIKAGKGCLKSPKNVLANGRQLFLYFDTKTCSGQMVFHTTVTLQTGCISLYQAEDTFENGLLISRIKHPLVLIDKEGKMFNLLQGDILPFSEKIEKTHLSMQESDQYGIVL